jgi:hypothetical protein
LRSERAADATRTANELNLLYFALIRLLFHVLSAFREPVHLRGMRVPTLVDLRDGARVEIGDGLQEIARRCFICGKVQVYCRRLCGENGSEIELAWSGEWHFGERGMAVAT